MASKRELPLVSFCLFAYNQADFIREAVDAALSQSYEPLEIILSDDCSSDETFRIMQEMTADYRGPHNVILNRNATNLGLGAHINWVAARARGKWLVMAAGDDVSARERVGRLMAAAEQFPDTYAMLSAWDVIDAHGIQVQSEQNAMPAGRSTCLDRHVVDQCLKFRGAVAAWRRELFTEFGPLQPDVWREDVVFAFRALLCGAIGVVPEALVRYRSHGRSISAGASDRTLGVFTQIWHQEAQQARWARMLHSALDQMKHDYDIFVTRRDAVAVEQKSWRRQLDSRFWISKCQAEWWQWSWRQKLKCLLHDVRDSSQPQSMFRWMLVRSGGWITFVIFSLALRFVKRCTGKGVC